MIISIFCKIIDNFGDVGVCWRLVKNLALMCQQHAEYAQNYQINLYIDDVYILYKMMDATDMQSWNICIHTWNEVCADNIAYDDANCVISTFACKLPNAYQINMPESICWIQLDYLATETWADNYHGLHAMLGKHKRYFFTPGFTHKTAGLFTKDFTITKKIIPESHIITSANKNLNMFIFAYITPTMLQHLHVIYKIHQSSEYNINISMPQSVYAALCKEIANKNHSIGTNFGMYHDLLNLSAAIHVCDFCTQNNFDALLQTFDIVWVRGEDSFIRAQLCAKPMLWQAYIQNEDVHLDKVNGFLAHYLPYFDAQQQDIIKYLWLSINVNTDIHLKQYSVERITEFYMQFFALSLQSNLNNWRNYLQQLPDISKEILNTIMINN
jgi:uncharacterized repeat protein (TIGR03837 family)